MSRLIIIQDLISDLRVELCPTVCETEETRINQKKTDVEKEHLCYVIVPQY